jgi:tetratricopeptide (TPR) repeat protein
VGSSRPRGRLNGIDIKPEVLRQARARAGLSLAQVAGGELTRQAVHLIETGKVRPSMNSLKVIANRLAIPVHQALVRPPPLADDGAVDALESLILGHHYDRALEHGRDVLLQVEGRPAEALVHLHLGHALCKLRRPTEALGQLKLAEELFGVLGNPELVAEAMELRAMALHVAEQPEALTVAEQALDRYRALPEHRPEVESRLLERVGTILAGRGEFAAARAHYEQALDRAGGVRDLARIARIYHGLGLCYLRVGDQGRAIDMLLKAETLYEAEQRINGSPPNLDLPSVENDLGLQLLRSGDLSRAEDRLQSALRRFTEMGMDRVRSHVLLSIGELRYRQRRYEEGMEVVQHAVVLAERFNETRALATGHKQLGELRAALGKHDQALDSLQRALAILEQAGFEERRAECLLAYERIQAGRGQTAVAHGA